MLITVAVPSTAWLASVLWDSSFEATPANSDLVSQGDDRIRDLKETLRDYLEAELNIGTAGDNNGRVREGSARGFYAGADPTTLNGTDRTGSNALGSTDDGRLLHRSDTGELKVWSGSAWGQALTSLSGTIELINTPLFAGTAAGQDTFDPREFTIRGIYTDVTTDGTACASGAGVSTTAIASQVFGDAGAACYSVTVDLSARSTANTRALVIGQLSVESIVTACDVNVAIYRDAITNIVGPLIDSNNLTSSISDGYQTPLMFAYLPTLSNASHEFAIHVSDSSDDGCGFLTNPDAVSGNFLTVIDLGPDY